MERSRTVLSIVRLVVHTGSSRLVLPVRERQSSDEEIRF
jgi:hypothetical protein